MSKKNKILKILFILTFVPYVLLIGASTFSFFFGINFFGSYYGFEGFKTAFLLYGFLLCYTGIIPVCAIIQIGVLIYHLLNRARIKKDNTKTLPKKLFVIAVVSLSVITLGILMWNIFEYQIKDAFSHQRAVAMYKRSEERIQYNLSDYGERFGEEIFIHDTILIDWDRKEIGFVTDDGYDRFVVYPLETSYPDTSNYYLQSEVTLEDGCEFYSYTDMEGHYTTELVVVVAPDGTTYGAEMHINEYLGLRMNCFNQH